MSHHTANAKMKVQDVSVIWKIKCKPGTLLTNTHFSHPNHRPRDTETVKKRLNKAAQGRLRNLSNQDRRQNRQAPPTPFSLGMSYIYRLTHGALNEGATYKITPREDTIGKLTVTRDIDNLMSTWKTQNFEDHCLAGLLFVTGEGANETAVYQQFLSDGALDMGVEKGRPIEWGQSVWTGFSRFVARSCVSFALHVDEDNALLAADANKCYTLTFQERYSDKKILCCTITTRCFDDLDFLVTRSVSWLLQPPVPRIVSVAPGVIHKTIIVILGLKDFWMDKALNLMALKICETGNYAVVLYFGLNYKELILSTDSTRLSREELEAKVLLFNNESEWSNLVRNNIEVVSEKDARPQVILTDLPNSWTFAVTPVLGYTEKKFSEAESPVRSRSLSRDTRRVSPNRRGAPPPNNSPRDIADRSRRPLSPINVKDLYGKRIHDKKYQRITFPLSKANIGVQLTFRRDDIQEMLDDAKQFKDHFFTTMESSHFPENRE